MELKKNLNECRNSVFFRIHSFPGSYDSLQTLFHLIVFFFCCLLSLSRSLSLLFWLLQFLISLCLKSENLQPAWKCVSLLFFFFALFTIPCIIQRRGQNTSTMKHTPIYVAGCIVAFGRSLSLCMFSVGCSPLFSLSLNVNLHSTVSHYYF